MFRTRRCCARVSPDVFYSGLFEAERTYVGCFKTSNRTLSEHILTIRRSHPSSSWPFTLFLLGFGRSYVNAGRTLHFTLHFAEHQWNLSSFLSLTHSQVFHQVTDALCTLCGAFYAEGWQILIFPSVRPHDAPGFLIRSVPHPSLISVCAGWQNTPFQNTTVGVQDAPAQKYAASVYQLF